MLSCSSPNQELRQGSLSSAAKKDRLEYVKTSWKGFEIYHFSRFANQNFIRRSTMVTDIFEGFEPPPSKYS